MPRTSRNRHPSRHQVIFGLHAVRAALANPARVIHAIHLTGNALARLRNETGPHSDRVRIATARDIERLAGTGAVHQGALVISEPLPVPDIADIADGRLVIALDRVSDPHNVGAILRSAAAFDAAGVVTTARHGPATSGVLAKAASGGLEHVPLVTVTNLARAMETLKDAGYSVIGLDSDGDRDLASIPVPGPFTLVLGAEGKGLRRLTRERCDLLARLEVPGKTRSLNVSNAAAVAMALLTATA